MCQVRDMGIWISVQALESVRPGWVQIPAVPGQTVWAWAGVLTSLSFYFLISNISIIILILMPTLCECCGILHVKFLAQDLPQSRCLIKLVPIIVYKLSLIHSPASTYYEPDMIWSTLQILTHLILLTTLLSLFYTWGNWGTERSSHLFKVIQEGARTGIGTQVCWPL